MTKDIAYITKFLDKLNNSNISVNIKIQIENVNNALIELVESDTDFTRVKEAIESLVKPVIDSKNEELHKNMMEVLSKLSVEK